MEGGSFQMSQKPFDGLTLMRQTTQESVVDHLRDLILSRQLLPGERLVQSELAEQLGVSRTPVREALHKLASEGLVTFSSYKGASVAEFSVTEMKEIYAVRSALESHAAYLAAQRITDEELERLEALLRQIGEASRRQDFSLLLDAYHQFHATIYTAAKQQRLYKLAIQYLELTIVYQRMALSLGRDFSDPAIEHEEILAALRRRDADAARRLICAHLKTQEMVSSYALRVHFVGRESEMEILRTAWEQARSDGGGLVLISGERGVGKTRLVKELGMQAEFEGAWVVWGRCVESGGSAYQPWREVLRALIGCVENVDKAVMRRVGPVLATVLPELWERDYMTGLAPPAELDPRTAQQRLNETIAEALLAAAGLRATMVVIEDAQWADEATLELLDFLTRVPRWASLLVCVIYQSDIVGPEHLLVTLTGDRVRRIPLQPLLPEITTELVCSMLGLKELPTLLAERVQQTTGGNAFFVQELIRSLAEDGTVLQWTVTGWKVNDAVLQKEQLPRSIHQVVRRRLMHLSPQAQRVLQWAAVVGPVFWEGAVETIGWFSTEQIKIGLQEILGQELILERESSAFEKEREYVFASPIVREVSYASMPPEERQEHHGRVAAWLIVRDEQAGEYLGLIADHLEGAGQMAQAATYLRRAGEQAAAQFANAEAVTYFSRALELTPEDDLAGRYDLLLAREKVYDLQAAREAQRQDLATLQELAQALADDRRRAEVSTRQAIYISRSDRQLAIAAIQEAIRLAQAAQDASGEIVGYMVWGRILWTLGDPKAAQPHLERAVALAREAGLRWTEAESLRQLGAALVYQRAYAETRAHCEQALSIYRELGDRLGENRALVSLGDIPWRLGEYDKSRVYFEQALRLSREIGDRMSESMTLANLSLVFRLLGDAEAAQECGQQALRIAQEVDDPRLQGYALTFLGHALARLDRLAKAAESYRQALTLWRERGQHDLAMEPLAGLARVSLAQGDRIQAQAQVKEILNYLDQGNSLDGTDEPFWIYLTCYRVLCASQDPRARGILSTAHHLLQERAAKISDERMRHSFLGNVATHREIVREFQSLA
jgi:DNA-binding GntR family transcriptional regulator/tetratricopeptide (TPR) repeat protein